MRIGIEREGRECPAGESTLFPSFIVDENGIFSIQIDEEVIIEVDRRSGVRERNGKKEEPRRGMRFHLSSACLDTRRVKVGKVN